MFLRLSVCFLLYMAAWIAALPLLIVYSLFRPQDRAALLARLRLSGPGLRFQEKSVWIHACSVGEVRSIAPLISAVKIRGRAPVISTTTSTGFETACRMYPGSGTFILPFDCFSFFSLMTTPVLPEQVLVIETEIWPGMLTALMLRKVPVQLVNARISDDSYPRYRRVRAFLTPFLGIFNAVFAQSETDASRLEKLGSKWVRTMPSLKYWAVSRGEEPDEALFPGNFRYLIAASTHQGEEKKIVDAFLVLKDEMPDLRLMIAPRHVYRVPEVERLLKGKGLEYQLRTELFEPSSIVILNTMGELNDFYLLPGAVFVGGSLVPVGGHNPLEPLYAGKIPVTGPYVHNFRDIVDRLEKENLISLCPPEKLVESLRKTLAESPDQEQISRFFKELEKNRNSILSQILP